MAQGFGPLFRCPRCTFLLIFSKLPCCRCCLKTSRKVDRFSCCCVCRGFLTVVADERLCTVRGCNRTGLLGAFTRPCTTTAASPRTAAPGSWLVLGQPAAILCTPLSLDHKVRSSGWPKAKDDVWQPALWLLHVSKIDKQATFSRYSRVIDMGVDNYLFCRTKGSSSGLCHPLA